MGGFDLNEYKSFHCRRLGLRASPLPAPPNALPGAGSGNHSAQNPDSKELRVKILITNDLRPLSPACGTASALIMFFFLACGPQGWISQDPCGAQGQDPLPSCRRGNA